MATRWGVTAFAQARIGLVVGPAPDQAALGPTLAVVGPHPAARVAVCNPAEWVVRPARNPIQRGSPAKYSPQRDPEAEWGSGETLEASSPACQHLTREQLGQSIVPASDSKLRSGRQSEKSEPNAKCLVDPSRLGVTVEELNQIVRLLILAIPVAWAAWTVTHEEVFQESESTGPSQPDPAAFCSVANSSISSPASTASPIGWHSASRLGPGSSCSSTTGGVT